MTPIRPQFESLCANAYHADIQGSGSCLDFEPELIALLLFCQQHLVTHYDEVVACFLDIAYGSIQAPYETLAFCMHQLRLPEVLTRLQTLRDEAPKLSRTAYDRAAAVDDVEASYSDHWDDADLWAYYAAHNSEPGA